jgi:uncharacterized phage protein (TIGR01671 family)
MEREIKFSGKTPQGEWLYGDLQQCNDGTVRIAVNNECWNDDSIQSSDYLKILEVNPDTVGQFTGLHDKNGKEIYEGDIIAVNGIQIGYIVGGVRGYCYDVIYTPAKSNGEKAWPLYSVVTIDYPNKCEVIGNIHDNPELLKEE